MARERALVEEQLARIPLFANLDRRRLREVAGLVTELTVPAGTLLIDPVQGGQLVVVVEGAIEVRRGDTVVATGGPGMFVGEISLLTQRPPTAQVTTTAPSVIEVINRGEFQTLIADMPDVRQTLMDTMAARLEELSELDPTAGF